MELLVSIDFAVVKNQKRCELKGVSFEIQPKRNMSEFKPEDLILPVISDLKTKTIGMCVI